jgi:hypothetical protein
VDPLRPDHGRPRVAGCRYSSASLKAHLHADVTHLAGCNDACCADPDLHDRAIEICVPPVAEPPQTRICQVRVVMLTIQVLPDIRPNQSRMVQHAVEDLDGGLSPACQLTHQVVYVHPLVPSSGAVATAAERRRDVTTGSVEQLLAKSQD